MIIGIGIDIIEIDRIKDSVNKFGDIFLNKIYTQNEINYCLAKFNKYQHLAARFAAKEAIYKALSGTWDKVASWKNIEITNEQNGLPVVKFFGKLKDYLSNDKEIKISISHSDNYVACVALIYMK
ncbi:MAG: holo-ACP synthase [Ignavibacterium sp.]|mgnify:CR=1 FL=1|jgi:holo-[acyl-carrier protein] synthase|nr:holo-ACP synthase [Ignavibacterium sp.]